MATKNVSSGDVELRGEALDGAERASSVSHSEHQRKRNPDAELRTDGETDTLYQDGLELEDDSRPQIDTDGHDDNAH